MHTLIKMMTTNYITIRALFFPLLFISISSFSGCTHLQDLASPDQKGRTRYLSGPSVDIDNQDVGEYTTNQQKVMSQFIVLAGLTSPPTSEWKPVVNAGMVYVDRQCERYIDAIFWFNRYKKAAGTQVALIGAATAGVMGILESAAKEIATTAVLFGLATETINNIGNTVLYQLEPSGVRRILTRSQDTYKSVIANTSYSDQASAMAAIQGYLTLCLPSTLETEVNNAVSNAQFEPAMETGRANSVPVIRQVPPVVESISFKDPDVAAKALWAFLFDPKTQTLIANNYKDFQVCTKQAGMDKVPRAATFVSSPAYKEQRITVAKCLKLL